jgi:HD-GYP domain-containing protein (c-di-GMP phosphodiesterase class II)
MGTQHHNAVHQHAPLPKSLCERLTEIHQNICHQLPQIARVSFALYDTSTGNLKTYADSTTDGEKLTHYEYPLDKLPSLQECVKHRRDRCINDLSQTCTEEDKRHHQWLKEQNYFASLASPVFFKDDFIGFIFINTSKEYAFDETLCQELSPFMDAIRQSIGQEYEIIHMILETIKDIQKRNPKHFQQSKDHQERMFHFTKVIAEHIAGIYHLNDEQIDNITLFSRLHDIGKLSIPCYLLLKPEALAIMEKKQVIGHIEKGIETMNDIISQSDSTEHASVRILKEIVSYHHELLDGSGYPFGLKHQDIPISARIIAVANIFDALTSHRPYKQARSIPLALLELEKMVASGKLDRHCVNALRYNQVMLKEVLQTYPEADPVYLSHNINK